MWRVILLFLLLVGAVCGAVVWSGGVAEPAADFTFINRGDNKTLDPTEMSWMQDIRLAYALWEGLYTLDSKTLEPIHGCADPIEISDDQTVYTFHIRPTAWWSDGSRLRSDDFVFAWRRMLEQPAEYVALFHYIKGAKEYEEAYARWLAAQPPGLPSATPPPDFKMVGIQKIDDRTLRVTLEHPLPFFPALCAFPPFFPQHEESMRRFAIYADGEPGTGRIIGYDQHFTRPPNLVSNGPYRMTDWAFQRRVRMEKSPYYWDQEHVKSKIIDELIIEDAVGALRAYEEGRVDWLADVQGDLAAEMKARGRKDLRAFNGFGTYFYSINCLPKLPDGRDNPFADLRVRLAFAMAIDKRPIVQNVTRMGEGIATNYIPPGIFKGYASPPGQLYDVAQAKKLLAEAGYPDGRNFPRVSILFNKEGQHGDIALHVRHEWQQNLNVDVELEGVEIKTFADRLHKREYAVARASWIGDYADPSTFTDKYRSDSDNNDSAWVNAEYDRLCDAAVRETDSAASLRLFAQAEAILLKEVPIIPMYYYRNAYLFRDNVHGIALDAKAMVMFKAVEVRR
jgi:oligopeptide transport system substrate-binding protein